MNCIDFRRNVYADPRAIDAEGKDHVAECIACRQFLEKQREMDAELFNALQVTPPDGLADRILVARGLRPARRQWLWAAAASLLVGVGSIPLFRALVARDAVGIEAIEHVAHEPESFSTVHAVGTDFLPALLANQGLRPVASMGQVTYARICPFGGKTAHHLVVRGAQGSVTIFLFPDDPQARTRAVTEKGGMAAITVPAARGSVAIVAGSLAQAGAIEGTLQRL